MTAVSKTLIYFVSAEIEGLLLLKWVLKSTNSLWVLELNFVCCVSFCVFRKTVSKFVGFTSQSINNLLFISPYNKGNKSTVQHHMIYYSVFTILTETKPKCISRWKKMNASFLYHSSVHWQQWKITIATKEKQLLLPSCKGSIANHLVSTILQRKVLFKTFKTAASLSGCPSKFTPCSGRIILRNYKKSKSSIWLFMPHSD